MSMLRLLLEDPLFGTRRMESTVNATIPSIQQRGTYCPVSGQVLHQSYRQDEKMNSTLHYDDVEQLSHKPHLCYMCNKRFTLKCNLLTHLLRHSGERPHPCDLCNKRFFSKSNLQNHLLSHSGEKPHSCDVCSRAFAYPYSLKRHLLTHTGKTPHLCDVCGKTFSDKYCLKRHLLTHTKEKSLICIEGNKEFSKKSDHASHMTHTGEKPRSCGM